VLADLGLGEAADRALVKLLAGLPAARRREAEAARGYLHVDPTGWRRSADAAPLLPELERGLRLGRRMTVTYERAFEGGAVERVVDPLGLVAKGSTWYFVAAVGDQVRTYRASRVLDVAMLDEPAARPPGFDLATWWAGSRAEFEAKLPVYRASVRISPQTLPRARWGWTFGRIEDEGAPDPDGWVSCRVRFDTLEVAVDAMLGLGVGAEVVEPLELRDRVIDTARQLVARRG
jgi:predicted DNA-binding transcriptional regulator YafY